MTPGLPQDILEFSLESYIFLWNSKSSYYPFQYLILYTILGLDFIERKVLLFLKSDTGNRIFQNSVRIKNVLVCDKGGNPEVNGKNRNSQVVLVSAHVFYFKSSEQSTQILFHCCSCYLKPFSISFIGQILVGDGNW